MGESYAHYAIWKAMPHMQTIHISDNSVIGWSQDHRKLTNACSRHLSMRTPL